MKFEGRTALVTGASRGIGRAIAIEFARRGAAVALIGRDAAALRESRDACANARSGAVAEVFECDVTDRAAVDRTVDGVMSRFGRVDYAIANAGQSIDALLLRLKSETIDRLIDVNLKSAFYLCGAVAKPMMKQRGGS
ncbi:MAG: SDR family NAD(P)-dependent oxidoreductase, partial [Candidatus Eremiobacteraeota bacterium]|nr:SDR family NAD(P)-dependent oxidoreductase [Candidatus Eremiobacteraeota bacterium]